MFKIAGQALFRPRQDAFKVSDSLSSRHINSKNAFFEIISDTSNYFDTYLVGFQKERNEPEYLSNLLFKYSGSFLSTLQELDRTEKKLSIGAWFIEDTRTLYLSRDLFGAVPIFYHHVPGKYVSFSTSLADLLRQIGPASQLEVNKTRILTHLNLSIDDPSYSVDTFYSQVKCVPPGHVVEITDQEIQTKNYVQFNPDKWSGLQSTEEVAEVLFDLLRESVSIATSGAIDKPLSSHLSGGLDSSSISALIRHIYPDRAFHTIHSKSKFADSDESSYASTVAKKIKSSYHEVFQSENDFDLIRMQTPLYAAPVIAHLSTSSIVTMLNYAKDLGCEVMLTGQGGDSIIGSGLEIFGYAFDTKNWDLLEEMLEKRVAYFTQYSADEHKYSNDRKLALVRQYYYYNRIARAARRNFKDFISTYFELSRNVDISHIAFWKKAAKSLLNRPNVPNLPGNRSLAREDLAHKGITSYETFSIPASLRGNLGTEYTDLFSDIFRPLTYQSSANIHELGNHWGISSRAPMRNKRVLEFCMAVPDRIKFGQGRGREHFRSAMKDLLPYEVYDRVSKASFSSNYGEDMTRRMWNQAKDSIMDSKTLWEYVDRTKVEQEVSILNNPRMPFMQKSNSWALLTKVVTLSAWLDWLENS